MDRTTDAIAIAWEYLGNSLSPLQAGRAMENLLLCELQCWDGTGGAHGPLSAFYGAADAADHCMLFGRDLEQLHPEVRDKESAKLAAAQEHWRGAITTACQTLIEYASPNE